MERAGKNAKGRFRTGNIGGGRPKGARSRLGEEFLSAMAEDFSTYGAATIAAVRTEKPEIYLRVIASILPKEVVAEFSERTCVVRMPEPVVSVEEWEKRHGPIKPQLS